MKKAVLFVRVSTMVQEYKAQRRDIFNCARADGYSWREIEFISGKESATKLSEKEREGFRDLWACIDDQQNKIETVYCWELSRLSRDPETLYKYKRLFEGKQINLKTKTEGLYLFNSDGTLNENSDMPFAIYSAMIKNEIRLKNERAKRSKILNAEKGCFNGGSKTLFGYTYNKEAKKQKEYIVREQEAYIVREVFELYSTGKYGLYTLSQELLKQGISLTTKKILRILHSKEYIGEKIPTHSYKHNVNGKTVTGVRYTRTYPQIISREQFEKCRQVAKTNNTNVDKSKSIYYANHLIKCSNCGSPLHASKNRVQYRCFNSNNNDSTKKCKSQDSININVLDTLLWEVAKEAEAEFILNYSEKIVKEWENNIAKLQSEIDNSEHQYDIVKKAKRKQLSEWIKTLDDEALDKIATDETKTEKKRIEQDVIRNKEEIDRFKKLIATEQYPSTGKEVMQNADDINAQFKKASADGKNKKAIILAQLELSDDKARYDIIHKHIKKVEVRNESNKTKKITIRSHYAYGIGFERESEGIAIFYYDFRAHNKSKQIYQVAPDDVPIRGQIDYSNFPIVERFKSKQ